MDYNIKINYLQEVVLKKFFGKMKKVGVMFVMQLINKYIVKDYFQY